MYFVLLCFICGVLSADDLRPQFHIMPTKGWMNDPNGPMVYKNNYHLFFQYNPNGAVWGDMHWYHVISSDFAHWKNLPIALAPDHTYDSAGVFSGSVTILDDGTPVISYTGQLPNSSETQDVAYPADLNDVNLVNWVKPDYNPIIDKPPAQGNPSEFRDPTTAWKDPDNNWYMAVGTQYDRVGATLLYTSKNFKDWAYVKPLYTNSIYGGSWECPDFFPMGLNYIWKTSAESYGDIWLVGKYDNTTHSFTPVGSTVPLCYGKCYASKSFYDSIKKRQILWSWIQEEDNNGPARGWQGCQSLPAQIGVDANFIIPTTTPIPELQLLRNNSQQFSNIKLNKNQPVKLTQTRQGEILAQFTLNQLVAGSFGLRILSNGTYYTDIIYSIGNDKSAQLSINRGNSGSTGSRDTQGGKISILPSELDLTLHVFIDHSVVEVFGQAGRAHIISRLYTDPSQSEVYLISTMNSTITTSATQWSINPIWLN